jgi:hypothetical protein
MAGIKDLQTLLKSMNPELDKRNFVFCSITESTLTKLKLNSLGMFREKEGVTLIITKQEADKNKLKYEGVWSLITLNVNSDLQAIGFLAAISAKLAENKINLNAVSAYHHDHLFVLKEKSQEALSLLKGLADN